MRFLIVGQGAIGSMLGARLKQKHNEVFFVVRNPIRVNILDREGIMLFEKEHHIKVKCDGVWQFGRLDHPIEADYVIIATKSYDAKGALEKIKDMVPDSASFITIQNGIIPHIEASKLVGEKRHIILSLYDAAFAFSLNQVRLTGHGKNIITSFSPSLDTGSIKSIFEHAGFDISIEKDAFSVLYRKLFVNAIINPITAILRIKNGDIVNNKYAKELADGMISEIESLAFKLRLKDHDRLKEVIYDVIRRTENNKSSMLQDIEWKRRTEIDDIIGYILDLSEEYKVNVPKIKNAYLMVKAIESQYLR